MCLVALIWYMSAHYFPKTGITLDSIIKRHVVTCYGAGLCLRGPLGAHTVAGRVMGRDGAGIKFSMDTVLALTFQKPCLLDGVCHWARGRGCSSVGGCRRLSGLDR